jgi:hypothetical protein
MTISAFRACECHIDEYIFRLLIVSCTDRSGNNGELSNVIHRDGAPLWLFNYFPRPIYSSILKPLCFTCTCCVCYFPWLRCPCHTYPDIVDYYSLFYCKSDCCSCMASKYPFQKRWQSDSYSLYALKAYPFGSV